MIFAIETGGDYRRVTANDWKQAIRIAWKTNPPKELGILTRIAGKRWGYIDTIEALKIAGYKVKEEGPRVLSVTRERFSRRRRGRLPSFGL